MATSADPGSILGACNLLLGGIPMTLINAQVRKLRGCKSVWGEAFSKGVEAKLQRRDAGNPGKLGLEVHGKNGLRVDRV